MAPLEFMYVMGVNVSRAREQLSRLDVVERGPCRPWGSRLSGPGSKTLWCAAPHVGRLGHEVHAQKTMYALARWPPQAARA